MKEKIIETLRTVNRKNFPSFIMWLEDTDFFTAPCSKDHHLNRKGGLMEHSWNVYNLFKEKNKRYENIKKSFFT